jgi:hypothetical protein
VADHVDYTAMWLKDFCAQHFATAGLTLKEEAWVGAAIMLFAYLGSRGFILEREKLEAIK